MMTVKRCFTCGTTFKHNDTFHEAKTRDGKTVIIGSTCQRRTVNAGPHGYTGIEGINQWRVFITMMPICNCVEHGGNTND